MTTIFEQWKSYRQRVLPPDAHEIQVTECKRAFYAGVQIMLTALSNLMSDGDDIKEEDIRIIAGIHEELGEFQRNPY